MVVARAGDRFLRAVERPARGDVSPVLVAVGIADHHHLLSAGLGQMPAVDVEGEELAEDPRRRREIVEGLEEGHDAGARRAFRPPSQQQNRENVRGAPSHRDDERPQRRGAVERLGASEEAEQAPRLATLLVGGGRRQVGRLRWRLGQHADEPLGARPLVAPHEVPIDPELVEHPAEGAGQRLGFLPDVEARGVETKHVDLSAHGPKAIIGQHRR